MADLPADRLKPCAPFTYSAVDYFGPFLVNEGWQELKRYGVLFTCMASRAVHLEVANALNTYSLINAYRRFIERRGPVRQLRSDQGNNFMGCKNELKDALATMDQGRVRDELLKESCEWLEFNFNAPHASHAGGVWERQIRTVRSVLAALLDQLGTQLNDEALRTFMVKAEAIVNSWPLTVEDRSSRDYPDALSPNRLLTFKSKVVLPSPGTFQRADVHSRRRWRRVQYLCNEFWDRWRKSFLQTLQSRYKWIRTHLQEFEGWRYCPGRGYQSAMQPLETRPSVQSLPK